MQPVRQSQKVFSSLFVLKSYRHILLFAKLSQVSTQQLKADMVCSVAISSHPPTHAEKYQNGFGQLIIGNESC